MSLFDTSPGGFFALTNLVVYGFIALEAVMLLVGSMTGVALALALIVATALMIISWMNHLLADEDGSGAPAEEPTAAAPAAPAGRVVAPLS